MVGQPSGHGLLSLQKPVVGRPLAMDGRERWEVGELYRVSLPRAGDVRPVPGRPRSHVAVRPVGEEFMQVSCNWLV